jgi:Transposase DNA-binding/Transposase Tn5 dimerisation domain
MLKHNASSKPSPDTNWATNEFSDSTLSDPRRVKRLITIATDLAAHPTAAIPQACGTWDKTKAAYRFFDNDAIEPQDILAAHTQAALQRMQAHRIVLCAQDTTSLNYSTHPQTRGLGPISNNRDKTIGLHLHSTLAVTPEGQPLGVLHARIWARSTRTFGRSSNARNRTPRAQKESQKWMESLAACQTLAPQCANTMLVNITDREGDLYDLFAAALAPRDRSPVQLLVRVQHDRQVAHPQKYLLDLLAAQPVAGHLKIKVPRKDGQPARLATLSIRFSPVTLRPPCLKRNQPSLTLWAVEAREMRPPKGVKPVCWRLLTTLPVETLEAAVEKVRWYAQRWQIEVIHKVLKSGCKVEQRQLETAARLQRVVMVDLVVAWRVLALCKAGRETPEGLASDWLSSCEWRALWCYMNQRGQPPLRSPTVRQAVRWIGQLGGFLARRRDGQPGPIVIWRGLQQLRAITAAWKRFDHENCG